MLFEAIRNALDYPLRQLFRWRRPGLTFSNEDKTGLFDDLAVDVRLSAVSCEQTYREMYHLEPFYCQSKMRNYRINLYYLDLLQQAFNASGCLLADHIEAVDVGVSDWFYAQALYAFLSWFKTSSKRRVLLTGYEVDAFRVYADFYSRYDHAQAHLRGLTSVTYMPCGFPGGKLADQYDAGFLFFPFLFSKDHLKWGLPRPIFNPESIFLTVWHNLKKGGVLVIVNQGEEERTAQADILRIANVESKCCFQVSSVFYQYRYPHFVTVVEKTA